MADGDSRPGFRHAWQVGRDPLVEPDSALFDQHHDQRGGELLGDRSELEDRALGHGQPPLEIGEAVGAHRGNSTVTHDGDGEPGKMHLTHLLPQVVVQLIGAGRRHNDENEQAHARALERRAHAILLSCGILARLHLLRQNLRRRTFSDIG
ncbi:MAG TPA: hypothetical protein VE685_01465 [Thermoanaerobaculia bacterium]|nr:hypothetical protein [Thermoanaerobaculia bacterium]